MSLRFKPTKEPPKCQVCGYRLDGLCEPRCPECGWPFDPDDVTTYSKRRSGDAKGALLGFLAFVLGFAPLGLICDDLKFPEGPVLVCIAATVIIAVGFWIPIWRTFSAFAMLMFTGAVATTIGSELSSDIVDAVRKAGIVVAFIGIPLVVSSLIRQRILKRTRREEGTGV